MLATSTYAWFTANKTVTISDINVYVATSSGLQISTNATDWKTLILNDDITAGYTLQDSGNTLDDKNQFPTELSPVSTVGTANAGLLNMYKGTVAADMADGGTFKLTATKEKVLLEHLLHLISSLKQKKQKIYIYKTDQVLL